MSGTTSAPAPPVPRQAHPGRLSRLKGFVTSFRPEVWCLVLALVFNLFAGHSFRIGLPVSLDRLLLPAAFGLMLMNPQRRRVRPGLVHLLVLLFVGWILVSMASYGNLLDPTSLFALLDRVLWPFLLFTFASILLPDTRSRDLLLVTLSGIGLWLGVLAVLELFAPALVWPRYIVDPDIGMQFGRARGPFVASEGMGNALAYTGFAAAWASHRLPRWRIWLLGIFALDMLGVALALTRSVWVSVAMAAVVAVLLIPRLRRWIPAALGAGIITLVAVVALLPNVVTGFFERINQFGPLYDRLGSNDAAIRMLADRPLTGIGWRRFYPYGSDWVRQSDLYPMNKVVIEIHNVILSRAAELGIPAALVFVAIIILGPLSVIWHRRSTARLEVADDRSHAMEIAGWQNLALLIFTVWLVSGLFGPMAIPFPNNVAWLVAGVAAVHLSRPNRSPIEVSS